MNLGRIGIWSRELKLGFADDGERREAAAELEELGYGALWIPGGREAGVLDRAAVLLEATERVVVGTGILNIWMEEPGDVAAEHVRLAGEHGHRLLLGLGSSHEPAVGSDRHRRPHSAV